VPLIAEALARLRVKSVTIDGEGVVCGRDGVTDFDLLRAAVGRKGSRDAFLYAFDLLELDGQDLRHWPWETRRARLKRFSLIRRRRLRHPYGGEPMLFVPVAAARPTHRSRGLKR
jgi:bifunctional non-homologous end joining protein LigD